MTTKNKRHRLGLSISATLTAMILVTGVVVPATHQAYAVPVFDGRAIAMSIISPLNTSTFMDSGPLTSQVTDASPAILETPLASADGLISATMATDAARSQSAVGELILLPDSPTKIKAFLAMSESKATCSEVSGFSDVTSLSIGGNTVFVTGEPNQTISIPGVLDLIINEQIIDGNNITVNALHLTTPLGVDIVVSSSSSSATCSQELPFGLSLFPMAFATGVPSEPECTDFTTGGGWVKPPQNKGTFGFVAGYKNGGDNPRGNLEYHDHTSKINVHALDVLYYNCGEYDNSRVFSGPAKVNQETGYCYQAYVQDNGEPGKNTDYFAMWIWLSPQGCPSDGSIPTGEFVYAVGNYLGGGNIQLHAK